MKRLIATALSLLLLIVLVSFKPEKNKIPELGIVAPVEQDSIIYAAGFKMIGEAVGKMLYPNITEEQFQVNLAKMKAAKCRVFMCNIFFSGRIKIVGPEATDQRVLGYVDTVMSRARRAGLSMIVLGSGGARRIPEGYDVQKAQAEFIVLCRKMADIARKYKMMIALENLEKTESNFITSLQWAAEVVRAVNHPNFKLNADIFHMMREGEGPQSIINAGDLLVHSEIAEKLRRSLPGVLGDDFKPYLRALKKVSFKGHLFIEGNTNVPATDIPLSFTYLSKQLAEVYAEKD